MSDACHCTISSVQALAEVRGGLRLGLCVLQGPSGQVILCMEDGSRQWNPVALPSAMQTAFYRLHVVRMCVAAALIETLTCRLPDTNERPLALRILCCAGSYGLLLQLWLQSVNE